MKKHFSMIRGFHLADFFTLGNAASGMGAVFAAMSFVEKGEVQHLWSAAVLVCVALAFDILDGRVARFRHQHSPLGRELDSLADIISFGVAPAAMAFAAGMRGGWDLAALMYFVACGVSRLARFNVTAEDLSAGGDKVKYFEGTPIPSSVLLVGVLALAATRGRIGDNLWFGKIALGPFDLHPLVLIFVLSGSLMISKTIRIPKL